MWFAREFLESMEHIGFMCICLRSIKTPEANVEFIKEFMKDSVDFPSCTLLFCIKVETQ